VAIVAGNKGGRSLARLELCAIKSITSLKNGLIAFSIFTAIKLNESSEYLVGRVLRQSTKSNFRREWIPFPLPETAERTSS
jgi:hypothetical protein